MSRRIRPRLACFTVLLVLPGAARAVDEPLRIETYVEIVLRSNPAARAGRALEESGEAERQSARLLPDPGFGVTVGRGRPADAATGWGAETGLVLSQTLPWLPARSASIEAADRAAGARQAEATRTRWNLVSDARVTFYRLQETRALVDVARAADEDARSLLALVSRRTEAGEAREVDRIKARVEWLRQQRDLKAAERDAAAAEAVLRTLAVEPLPRPLLVQGDLPEPGVAAQVTDEALSQAIERSPDLVRARAEAARSRSLLSFARRSRVPDLGLSLFWNKEIDKDLYGLSFGVTVPLWSAKRGEIALATAASSLAEAEARSTEVRFLTELQSRRRDLDVAAGQAATLMTDLGPAAAEALRIARLLFEEGETSLLDLLDAQRTAREARREEIRARFDLAVALSELQRLLGPDIPTGR